MLNLGEPRCKRWACKPWEMCRLTPCSRCLLAHTQLGRHCCTVCFFSFHRFVKDNYPGLQLTVSDLSPFYLAEARSNMNVSGDCGVWMHCDFHFSPSRPSASAHAQLRKSMLHVLHAASKRHVLDPAYSRCSTGSGCVRRTRSWEAWTARGPPFCRPPPRSWTCPTTPRTLCELCGSGQGLCLAGHCMSVSTMCEQCCKLCCSGLVRWWQEGDGSRLYCHNVHTPSAAKPLLRSPE